MESIFNLQKRATELRNKTQVDSITPEEVGGLQYDMLAYIADMEQNSAGLGIRKSYTSTVAMYSDSNPIGSNGKPLRLGQLVVIYDPSSPNAKGTCDIYAYQKPGWRLMGNLTSSILDGTITSQKIASGAVTESKLSSAVKNLIESKSLTSSFIGSLSSRTYKFNGFVTNEDLDGYTEKTSLKIDGISNIKFNTDTNRFIAVKDVQVYRPDYFVLGSDQGSWDTSEDYGPNYPSWEYVAPYIGYFGSYGFLRTDGRVIYLKSGSDIPDEYKKESGVTKYYTDGTKYYVFHNYSEYFLDIDNPVILPLYYRTDFELDRYINYLDYQHSNDVDKRFLDINTSLTYVWGSGTLAEYVETPQHTNGTVSISGMLNLTDINAVKTAQSGLVENEARFFVIADSQGRIPSNQKCYDVPADVARQMSMTTGNTLVDAVLKNVEVDAFGVSVGDLIALAKVSVSLADLSEMFGLSFSLSGSILIYQYKILHTNPAREENYEIDCTKGARGLLTPWEKTILNGSAKPTRWAWGWNLDDCLQSGVLAYTNATIGETTANWTIFVDCAATPDGSGYYHLLQTAIGRDEINLGAIMTRLGYYKVGEAPTFLPWKVLAE